MRILYVDDDARVRTGVEAMLQRLGHDVLSCGSGEAALAVLRQGSRVDVLITDIEMPEGLDGWHTARAARRMAPGLRVLYLSAAGVDRRQAVPGGRFLRKPCTAVALQTSLAGEAEPLRPLPRRTACSTRRARATRPARLPLLAG